MTDIPQENDAANEDRRHQRALDEAEQRVASHPAVQQFYELLALRRMLDVWHLNWGELLALLAAAATNEHLAVELVQNVHAPNVRDQFHKVTTQRLHNYVAATMAVVDHVRRLMRDRIGPIADEFSRRKEEVIADPVVPFIQDLRNFTLHRTVPGFSHRLSFSGVNTPDQTMRSELGLDRTQLLEWKGWTQPSRAFLEAQEELVELRPLILSHGRLIGQLNGWLLNSLATDNEPGLEEANKLVAERNHILMGVDDDDLAQRMTEFWTEIRSSATPLSTDEMMERMRTAIGDAPPD